MEKIISIPLIEYEKLKQDSIAYKRLKSKFFEDFNFDTIDYVINDFKETNLYTDEFINDLHSIIEKSSNFDFLNSEEEDIYTDTDLKVKY